MIQRELLDNNHFLYCIKVVTFQECLELEKVERVKDFYREYYTRIIKRASHYASKKTPFEYNKIQHVKPVYDFN